ncbi:MAG TPA: glycosyltransferase family 4 protein [Candidatus Paceibacterota bacterium]|nr:glycosyltransferase family 4 protein [Candidatus Paceibacterota bacterium]
MEIISRKKQPTTPKKIAIVSDAVYPHNKGGKEKRLHDITTRLVRDGYDVTIYCMQWWEGPKTVVHEGVKFCAISPLYPLYNGDRRSIREAILFALHCFKLLTKSFDVIDVDHIPHLSILTIKIVCLLRRKKMIATWHEVWGKEYWKEYLGGWKATIAYLVEWLSVQLPTTIIAVSDHTAKSLEKLLGSRKKIVTIPNGLQLSVLRKSPHAALQSDIIFAGRLLFHKNVDVLLRAIKILKEKIPTISAVIVGDGPEKVSLEQLAKDLAIEQNVIFLGFVERDIDLYGLMKSSKVFVLPSVREGFGIVTIEANACGLPVVTTNHKDNATKDLIEEGVNGYVVRLNEKAFAQKIFLALSSRTKIQPQKNVDRYDWQVLMMQLENTYKTAYA